MVCGSAFRKVASNGNTRGSLVLCLVLAGGGDSEFTCLVLDRNTRDLYSLCLMLTDDASLVNSEFSP